MTQTITSAIIIISLMKKDQTIQTESLGNLWSSNFVIVTIAAAALLLLIFLYTPTLGGFWLSDDFGNLYRSWLLDQQHQMWSGTLAFFSQPVDEMGAFYRPMMIASINLSFLLFEDHYFFWASISLLVHIINAVLIVLLIQRLLQWSAFPSRLIIALLAGLLFAFNPVLTEAVVWVSTRSDRWVTLLSLIGLWCWTGKPGRPPTLTVWAMPLCLLFALGFKESAVILPLQILLLAMIWPGGAGRARWLSLGAAFLLVIAFMLWRASLFGNAVEVYRGTELSFQVFSSLPKWWHALFSEQTVLSIFYLSSIFLLISFALMLSDKKTYRLGLALLFCGGGLFIATLINLGSLSSSGEGGRLLYGPIAWLALCVGVLANTAKQEPRQKSSLFKFTDVINLSFATYICWFVLLLASFFLLQLQIKKFDTVQLSNFNLSRSIPAWAEQKEGLTLLFVPDKSGSVIALRNAQGALVMPPIQQQPYLHRMLPTLISEIELRYQQFMHGLAWQLREAPPEDLSDETFSRLFEQAPVALPERIACWDQVSGRIHVVVDSLGSDWNEIEAWYLLEEEILRTCPLLE